MPWPIVLGKILNSLVNPLRVDPVGTTIQPISVDSNSVQSGTEVCTPKFARINENTSGNHLVVNAVFGKRIRVLRWTLAAAGSVNVGWKSEDSTVLCGPMAMIVGVPIDTGEAKYGIVQTAVDDGLVLTLSANVQVGGCLTYIETA